MLGKEHGNHLSDIVRIKILKQLVKLKNFGIILLNDVITRNCITRVGSLN